MNISVKPAPAAPDAAAQNAAAAQHAALGLAAPRVTPHTIHPQAQWFPRAGLGLFIHWGIASVHGNVDLSWGMIANTPWDAAANGTNKITPEAYWQLAPRFNPDRYDPEPWIKAAAQAGFQYAVLTTMHHDGYTLWPSQYSDFGVQSHLQGRDLVQPFVEACRRHGLKVGLYYSPPDWHFDRAYKSFNYGSQDAGRFPGRPHFDIRHQNCTLSPMPAAHEARRRAIFHHRVVELLTRYGHIDLLWFDGGAQDNEIRDQVRQLQPHIILNSRSCAGDFDCTECRLPSQKFTGWFETCHTWGTAGWGYTRDEHYESTAWMLDKLVQLRTWGGNLLINVGPRPNGELPPVVYNRFSELSTWMAKNRDSVIDTDPGPYPQQSNVPATIKAGVWYLHLRPGVLDSAIVQDVDRPSAVVLLRTGTAVPHTWHSRKLEIPVAPALRSDTVDVLAVHW